MRPKVSLDDLIVSHNAVALWGHRIERPSHINVADWIDLWEKLRDVELHDDYIDDDGESLAEAYQEETPDDV